MGNSCFGVGHGPMGLCYTEVSSVKKKKKDAEEGLFKNSWSNGKEWVEAQNCYDVHEIADTVKSAVKNKTSQTRRAYVM